MEIEFEKSQMKRECTDIARVKIREIDKSPGQEIETQEDLQRKRKPRGIEAQNPQHR